MTDTVQQFDTSVNLLQALLWQHDNAESLKTIIQKKQEWYNTNQRDFWDNWYRDVFNIDTANEFGLSVWARILNVKLSVTMDATADRPSFGFGINHLNFNNGNFARRYKTEQYLTLSQQRLVIKLRYFQLVTDCTVPEINEWLAALFADQGTVFVVDDLDMTMRYFFRFVPDQQLRFILTEYDLLPRPAGVESNWQIQTVPSFGFSANHLNFNNGNFGA